MAQSAQVVEHTQAEQLVIKFLPDELERRVVLKQLLQSVDYASAVAPDAWSATLYKNLFRVNVGRVEVLVVSTDFVRFNCMGTQGEPPFVGDNFESPIYRSVRDPMCAYVGSISAFAAIEQKLQPYHRDFIDTVGRTRSGVPVAGSALKKSHSPGLIAYARNYISDPISYSLQVSVNEDQELLPKLFLEGAPVIAEVNRYERDAGARQACLEHYGKVCCVCSFSPASVYGEELPGLIHVHHLIPLSEIGEEYKVNPITDLRPVCPNCHAAIHSRDPAYAIEEVATMIRATRSRTGRA